MATYFLSDLHLKPERLDLAIAFGQFLATTATDAERIYLLGDLFEYWIGDDAAQTIGAAPVLEAMKVASQHTECFFIAGNRDFLTGAQFERESGFKILADETVIDLYGTPTLLLHGDSLCTDDHAHMAFREEVVTNEERKRDFLQLSIPERIEQAQVARAESGNHKASVSMEIMDVTLKAVEQAFEKYSVAQMIHGHTHRQHIHSHKNDCTRYVLGDWNTTSSILVATADDLEINNQAIQT